MAFKLFHKHEEISNDDKIKENMYIGITPVASDIRALLGLDLSAQTDKFIMANYDDVKMDESPLEELLQLKNILKGMNVRLALCKGSAVFFVDLNEIFQYKDIILNNILDKERFSGTGVSWLLLVNLFWDLYLPMATVRVRTIEYEVTIFIKGQKPRKEVIRKP